MGITKEKGQNCNFRVLIAGENYRKITYISCAMSQRKGSSVGFSSREGFGRSCQMLVFCKRGFTVCSYWLQVVSDGIANKTLSLPANITHESEIVV